MTDNPYEAPESNTIKSGSNNGKQKLTSGSLFKVLFVGFLFGLGPIFFAGGVYGLVTGGESMVSLNGARLTGMPGFIGTVIFTPLMVLIFSGFTWLFVSVGNWFYSLFWTLNLKFK